MKTIKEIKKPNEEEYISKGFNMDLESINC